MKSLIDVRIWFLLNNLRTNRQIETKFFYTYSLTRLTSLFFAILPTELRPLIDDRILFFFRAN